MVHLGIQIVGKMQHQGFLGHGQLDRPQGGIAVMAENQVFEEQRIRHGKVSKRTDLLLQNLDPQHHVTNEAANGGIIDGEVVDKFLDLPDIVNECACHQEVPVQVRIKGGKL